jgi:hypothetical protein
MTSTMMMMMIMVMLLLLMMMMILFTRGNPAPCNPDPFMIWKIFGQL